MFKPLEFYTYFIILYLIFKFVNILLMLDIILFDGLKNYIKSTFLIDSKIIHIILEY